MSEAKILTAAIIKDLLTDTVYYKGNAEGSFNDITSTGFYQILAEKVTGEYPPGAYKYGLLLVLKGHNFCVQIYAPDIAGPTAKNGLYYRSKYDASFRNWLYFPASYATSS